MAVANRWVVAAKTCCRVSASLTPAIGPFEIAVVSVGFSYWRTTTHMLGVPPKSSGGATNRCVMSRLTK